MGTPFSNLKDGSISENGTKIQGWQGPLKGALDPDQDWILYWTSDGNGYQYARYSYLEPSISADT